MICEAKYEFGIMIDEPKSSEDYINYIPKRYNCISADDIFIAVSYTHLTLPTTERV